MKTFVIRTLGGKQLGYGHFYRCLSLAKALVLLEKDIKIIFIVNDELVESIENTIFDYTVSNKLDEDFNIIKNMDIDLFVLDSYLGDNEYLKKIKDKSKVMLIDDNNDIYDSLLPDVLYNGNIYASELGYADFKNQLQLLGSKYLVMKEEYWVNKKDEYVNKEGVLVTTGGTDKYGVMIKIINAIKVADFKIRVVIGPGYSADYIRKIEEVNAEDIELIYMPNSLKEFINSSKVVITAGGSTVYEVLSQKSIPIIYSIADNQDLICTTLNQMGVEYLGKYSDIEYANLGSLLEKVYNKEFNKADELYELITGEGALLVAKELLER